MAVNASSLMALAAVFLVAIFTAATAASAQGLGMAPEPSPDAGSAHSLPISGAVVLSSVVLCLVALMKH